LSLKGCSSVMARQLKRSPICRRYRKYRHVRGVRGARGAAQESGGCMTHAEAGPPKNPKPALAARELLQPHLLAAQGQVGAPGA
jgi:hypothetical protein